MPARADGVAGLKAGSSHPPSGSPSFCPGTGRPSLPLWRHDSSGADRPHPYQPQSHRARDLASRRGAARHRRTVLYDPRGKHYDANHPDDRLRGNRPLLLTFRAESVGAARLDCPFGDSGGIIRTVAIDQPEQGRGHGRALISLVVSLGHRLNLSALEINSAAEAVGFYQRLGFALIDADRNHHSCA